MLSNTEKLRELHHRVRQLKRSHLEQSQAIHELFDVVLELTERAQETDYQVATLKNMLEFIRRPASK